MAINFKLQPSRPLDRSQSWGCLMANLAMPGSGSLLAGRIVGYFQMALALAGFILSSITGTQLFIWILHNANRITQSDADPTAYFVELWKVIKWPLLGLTVFFLALLWAVFTSIQILCASPKQNPGVPPKL